jgi:hypothetical protein
LCGAHSKDRAVSAADDTADARIGFSQAEDAFGQGQRLLHAGFIGRSFHWGSRQVLQAALPRAPGQSSGQVKGAGAFWYPRPREGYLHCQEDT